ncbi:tRNA adenosine(34) deaminase TadA [Pelosinus sp. IPA-1]|uniref:tRNA adenosine(34) deaminase TadA n=1 Tax=Pelosinus sp. IPA-1 TaxID=3029569 RepID=UPI0024361D1A|nr:tRNA adenosine(34) deaminase TadA [Pelosinus sp. IPA-1]GMA99826.1 tRNA-specific adenosine deaminase [Pelosinus sp. IPA-1]
MLDDNYFMGLALLEAQKAYDIGEVPIGSVLVLDGQVVATGHNMREIWHDATAHAEMIAIREACEKLGRWRLTGLTLYATIEPCPMCAGALVMSRIDRLVYGSVDVKAGAIDSIFNIVQNEALNHRMIVRSGVRADECAEIMKKFFRERRKKSNTSKIDT